MIEDLLSELSATGWTISWAFQYAPSEWRMSIIREEDVGTQQGSYTAACAFAPTFAEALEECLSKRAEAEFQPAMPQGYIKEILPITKPWDLASALGLRSTPIKRRV